MPYAKKKSPVKKYGTKSPTMKKKSTAKKKSPMKMVKSFGNAGMVGTAKKAGVKKAAKKTTAKKQGYNDRLDESIGMILLLFFQIFYFMTKSVIKSNF